MATIDPGTKAPRRPGVRRAKKHNLKTDMTPMVDLGFLLITFFVFTAELSRPQILNLAMPKEGKPSPLAKSAALTVMPAKGNMVYYYFGDWEASKLRSASISVYNGLGQVIRAKQEQLDKNPVNGEGRNALMLLVKPGPEASYKLVIDVLDEALINGVKRYALLEPGTEESAYLKSHAR